MKWLMTLGITCVLLAACMSSNGDGLKGRALTGTTWKLMDWSASSTKPSQFTITADFSKSQIAGTAAVNLYGGPYSISADGAFSVGELHSTRMAGPAEAMQAESLYFDLLRQARQYVATQTTLTLKDGNNQNLLIFKEK